MALYDLDTSAVVKRYVLETGTAWVQALTDPTAGNGLFLLRLAQAEMVAAITAASAPGTSLPRTRSRPWPTLPTTSCISIFSSNCPRA